MRSVGNQIVAAVSLSILLGCNGCGSGGVTSSNSLVYGSVSTFAGTGKLGYAGDGGPATSAVLYQPYALAFDTAGNLYVGDAADNVVRRIATGTGLISTYAGVYAGNTGGSYSGNGGGASNARFYGPFGLAVDSASNLYVSDEANNVVRKISAVTGTISAFAGNALLESTPNGTYTGDGGPALSAGLNHAWKIAFDAAGNLFICDTQNGAVRKVSVTTGNMTTVAGTGVQGQSADGGPATSAKLYRPVGIAFDAAGNFYIADQATASVRKVTVSSGVISTVAGSYTSAAGVSSGYSGDGGLATRAQLSSPSDVAIDGNGDLIIADTGNNVVRRVSSSTGIIDTIAGTTQGYGGDGGSARSAQLNNPYALAFDATGNLYIADSANGAVRRVMTSR